MLKRIIYDTNSNLYIRLKNLLKKGITFKDIKSNYYCLYGKSKILAIKERNIWYVNIDNWGIEDLNLLPQLDIEAISPGAYAIDLLKIFLKNKKYTTFEKLWPKLNNNINKIIKSGYNSGILYSKPGFYKQKCYHYDINSAYGEAFIKSKIPVGVPKIINGFVEKDDKHFNLYCMDLNVDYNSYKIFPYLVNTSDIYQLPSEIIVNTGVNNIYKVISEIEFYDLIKDYEVNYECFYTLQFDIRNDIFEDFIIELYNKKNEYQDKKRDIYKNILASLAGKFSQEIKHIKTPIKVNSFGVVEYDVKEIAEEDVIYLNPVISISIVDYVRKKIRDVIKSKGYENILLVDTDGFISLDKFDIPISKKLGEWKVKEYDNVVINGNRSYFYTENNEFHSSISGLGDIHLIDYNNYTFEQLKEIVKFKNTIPILKKISFQGITKYITYNINIGGRK